MGFQYELDGSVETHDPALPSTTACPYLPGQTVNTLIVPVEQALRQRSASLNSMCESDLKTMNPESKYNTPRPAPSAPANHIPYRVGSSPSLHQKASSRSLSPAPAAWKRFFGRKTNGSEGERGRSPVRNEMSGFVEDTDYRCTTPSDGTRTRDISPESLRRFLSDDVPRPGSNLSERPSLIIPEDVVEDNENENDDDDNFATSAVSEGQAYVTGLSPPPFKRSVSSESVLATTIDSSSRPLVSTKPSKQSLRNNTDVRASAVAPPRPRPIMLRAPHTRINPATSFFLSPATPNFPEDDGINFFDLTDDEDDVVSNTNSEILSFQPASGMPSTIDSFECYSLPESHEHGSKITESQSTFAKTDSPALMPRSDSAFAVTESNFLGAHIDTGLDNFAAELGWMADIIGSSTN
ncbi:Ff.00g076280.m01.CDS01 [Fusarium sp. VM40]|nr:Ff.00g076280.m01.CDS01 [Fusarium sp. VM40]